MIVVCFVTFCRELLTDAARKLSPEAFRVLVLLGVSACPRTARVWTTPLRLAQELGTSPALIDASLSILLAQGYISLYARSHGALRCYQLGPVFQRVNDEPPANLPVEPIP